jgi:hypothetical protein
VALSTRPFLAVYIAWHPDYGDGAALAKMLYNHYRREIFANVAGGAGLSVVYRSTPLFTGSVPLTIDLNEAETTAIIFLIEKHWVDDPAFVSWSKDLMNLADDAGLSARTFPVALDDTATKLGFAEQAVRWDRWDGMTQRERERRLLTDLTYQLCRMLRTYLERLEHPAEGEETLQRYLKKVEVFLSHSKHDKYGAEIARKIRDYLYNSEGLASFFDVHDIPAGLRFDKVILQKLKVSAVVAVYTDSYSSREWCRREIIEAKRWNVPLVIANCMADFDERCFPYLGNVPVVRMDPEAGNRIDAVVGCLLDEVLKDFLWRCRVRLAQKVVDNRTMFLPRPPELLSLVGLVGTGATTLVYPDPPLGDEEQRLFETLMPTVQLRSMTVWLAEAEV